MSTDLRMPGAQINFEENGKWQFSQTVHKPVAEFFLCSRSIEDVLNEVQKQKLNSSNAASTAGTRVGNLWDYASFSEFLSYNYKLALLHYY